MATTSEYLEQLQTDMATLKTNVQARGVEVTDSDNFTTLSAKVADIPSGGGDLSDYFASTISPSYTSNASGVSTMIKQIPSDTIMTGNSLNNMFSGCLNLESIPMLDTSTASTMVSTFQNCNSLKTIPLLDTSNVVNMQNAFMYCLNLETIPLLDTSNVTAMSQTFSHINKLTTIPLLNTSKVRDMSFMFNTCVGLATIPQLDTSSVTNMQSMFRYCYDLTTVPQLDTSSVTNMQGMFEFCRKLSNDSVNNILAMCTNATSYTSTKTLYYLGFRSSYYPVATIETLSNYQDFLDAGWTIGY